MHFLARNNKIESLDEFLTDSNNTLINNNSLEGYNFFLKENLNLNLNHMKTA